MKIEKLAEVRKSRGLTQQELGRRVGITSQSRMSSIERGLHVSPELAQRCADVLLCNVNDLVRPEDPVITLRVSDLTPDVLQAIGKR